MAAFNPYEQGGITGGANLQALLAQLGGGTAGVQVPGVQSDTPAPPAAAPASPASGLGSNKLSGFDMNKFADPGRSEKYKIGEVMSRYDPRQGVSQAMLDELNGLGLADFSGSGDQLTVKNTKNDPRFGTGGTADVIKGLKGNNEDTAWQPWYVGDQQDQNPIARPTAGGGFSPIVGATLDPKISGDPMAAIQQALQKYSGQGPNLQALLAQFGGQ